jgi:hypothetical protein
MNAIKYRDSIIERAYSVALNKYSTPEQQDVALQVLAFYQLLTESVLEDARRAKYQSWIDLCCLVIREKERELSKEWFDLRLDHETELELPEWITGKVVCNVQDGRLIINLRGRDMVLMNTDVAASQVYESLDGTFRLRYVADANTMVIDQFVSNPVTFRRIRASS